MEPKERKVPQVLYSERWWILSCVVLLKIARSGHTMSYASVTKHSAKYYDQTGDRIDLFLTLPFLIRAPFWIFNAYAIETWGLKINLKAGGLMICFGKLKMVIHVLSR